MGWDQQIEYVDAKVTSAPPVKKQVWDGEKFVPMTLYRHQTAPTREQMVWLHANFGGRANYIGSYWDYSITGNWTVMDEKVYVWYQMKWGNK